MKPNILLLMTDQQRADALGCVTPWMETPHMDRIATEGVRFSRCVTNSPVCIPTRRSMATGHYPHNTGIWRNQETTLDPEAPNWMRAVREAGYRTSVFGKTHLNHAGDDLRERAHLLTAQGIDDVYETVGPRQSATTLSHMTAEWESLGIWDAYKRDFAERFATKPHLVRPSPLGFEHYYDTHVGQKAKAYLEAYERDQPWFCWVTFGGPHEPWDTPEPWFSHYDAERMPPALSGDLRAGERPNGHLDALRARMPALTPDDVAAMRANYAGNVSLIDDQVGQLFSAIEQRGEWQNTVVVLCSDHGEMNGDHGLIYKSNFLDSALRVPLLVKGPGVARGVCEGPVEWFDVGPTLAEFAGTELDFEQFAVSLMPSLRDPAVATTRRCAVGDLRGSDGDGYALEMRGERRRQGVPAVRPGQRSRRVHQPGRHAGVPRRGGTPAAAHPGTHDGRPVQVTAIAGRGLTARAATALRARPEPAIRVLLRCAAAAPSEPWPRIPPGTHAG